MSQQRLPKETCDLYDKVGEVMREHHEDYGRDRENITDLWDATRMNAAVLALHVGNMAAAPVNDQEAEEFLNTITKWIRERFDTVRTYNKQHATPVKHWEH